MFKQSLGLVSLQIVSILIGVFSFVFVAKNVNPNTYSLVAISTMIITIVTIFSTTGLEQFNLRHLLGWEVTKNTQRIKILIQLSILSRVYLSIFINILLIPLYFYLSIFQYDGNYLTLFLSVGVASIFSSITDSIYQIYRSLNRALKFQSVSIVTNSIFKILAISLFMKLGIEFFILIGLIGNLFLVGYFLFEFSKKYSIELYFQTNIKFVLSKLRKSNIRIFRRSAYISYLYRSSDQLVVSIFAPPSIIGSYGFCKNILDLSNVLLQNIFDPLIQRLVEFRNNSNKYNSYLNKVIKTRNLLMIFMLILLPLFYFEEMILLNFNQYPNILSYLIFIYFSQFLYLANVIDIGKITLFEGEKVYLKIVLIQSIVMLLFQFIFLNLSYKLLFLNFTISNLSISFYIFYLRKSKKIFVNEAR
jgi:O-antigen/teichoic acid export membrane protein